jgi:hypothetical protein
VLLSSACSWWSCTFLAQAAVTRHQTGNPLSLTRLPISLGTHEARHAEQWFLMARMLAGQRRSATQIAVRMSIPPTIATQAIANPAAPGSAEAVEAAGFFESVYGGHAEARNQTINEVEALDTKLKAADKAFKNDPTPANQAKRTAAKAAFDEAHARYRNLPEEGDAARQDAAVTAAYGRL